eukprot:5284975-Amphidinium_carterae.1
MWETKQIHHLSTGYLHVLTYTRIASCLSHEGKRAKPDSSLLELQEPSGWKLRVPLMYMVLLADRCQSPECKSGQSPH